jgi:hypothetical protein
MQWRRALFAVIWGPVTVLAFIVSVSIVEISRQKTKAFARSR